MEFQCENAEVYHILGKIYQILTDKGAYFHPGIVMTEVRGEFSIICTPPAKPMEQLMLLPESCLPPESKFQLSAKNGTILIQGSDADVTTTHRACFEKIVSLYNTCQKLESFKKTSPWFSLASQPDVLSCLVAGRGKAPKLIREYQLWKENRLDELMLKNFMGSRTMRLNSLTYNKTVRADLMFIDCLNHHSLSPGFQLPNVTTQQIGVVNSQPIAGSQECFVRYNLYDPFDTLMTYGFVDESSQLCRSIPLEILLPGGISLDVESSAADVKNKNALPRNLKDLYFCLPNILARNGNSFTISHLIIPGPKAPQALRRVLAIFIGNTIANSSPSKLAGLVKEAEAQVLQKNMAYYETLEQTYATALAEEPDHMFLKMTDAMVRRQKKWLRSYDERLNIGIF